MLVRGGTPFGFHHAPKIACCENLALHDQG